ncbi:MAG: metal ABC transporter ATP-binding protein [Lapillicoccus sp.]
MTTSPTAADPIVSLREATFGYADHAVVRHVTLDIHAGEVVAILGPNGAGKSTVVKGLLGLSDRLSGDVRLFGTPLDRFRDHARLGYVPQRHTLSGSVRATAEEIVSTGRLVRQGWFGRASATDRQVIARALEIVGLADRASIDVSTLSGGQQRRVLIARALAAQPDVLIMDEPTAGVDTANQHVLAEVLGRLADQGVTMLVVTHEMDAFVDVVTRVVVVDHGGVAYDGPRDAFLAQEREFLHEHHTHHHDHELTDPRPSLTGAPDAGPVSTTTHPNGRHRD